MWLNFILNGVKYKYFLPPMTYPPHLLYTQFLKTPYLVWFWKTSGRKRGVQVLSKTTLRCLIKGYTRLFNFRNFDTLPSLIRVYPLIKFWKICLASPFFTFRNSRKCLPYPFIRYIFTLPFYLIFKNIPLYPLIRVYPFIRHLRVNL